MKTDCGLLLLRLAAGLTMLLSHGWGKLLKFSVMAPNFPDPIGLGGQVSLALTVFAEVFCALFVAVGFFTRWTALPLLITMAVAFFIIHGGDPFQKKEMAFLYLCLYGAIALLGPGRYSLDRFIKR